MNYSNVGSRIRELRRNMHITQEELGKALGVSMQAVSKWECGGSPDIELLAAIADFFCMSIDALFGRTAGDGDQMEEMIYQNILHTRSEMKMERACSYGWAIMRGLSGISTLSNYKYGMLNKSIDDCALARVSDDNGLAYMAATEEYHYFMVMPEPKGGFNNVFCKTHEYEEFFSLLGKPNRIRLLSYLYSRSCTLFSTGLVAKALKLSEKEAIEMLKEFEHYKWITEETVDTEEGNIIAYRLNHNKALIPLLCFAQEFMSNIRLWHLNADFREKPLLKSMLQEDNPVNKKD